MKKKLLLILSIVIMVACLFVVTTSAETHTTIDGDEVEITTYNDAPTKTNITVSTDDVVVLKDGDDIFVCPSAYVFKDSSTIASGKWGSPSLPNSFDFEYINGKTGKTYTFANVVEVDIPQGITSTGVYLAHKVTTLKRISFPDSVTSISSGSFEECTSIVECVFEHNENSNLTVFPQYFFSKATSLKSFSMPDCITSMAGEGYHFANLVA